MLPRLGRKLWGDGDRAAKPLAPQDVKFVYHHAAHVKRRREVTFRRRRNASMAGTDRRQKSVEGGPAVVLVRPQLGENIGTAARAMANFGLDDLRLVAPRDGWPNGKARAAASGADNVIDSAQVFETTAEAIADLTLVLATTARARDMVKPVETPKSAVARLATQLGRGENAGVLFGPERAGLHNDDVALSDAILAVPVNPAFSSLNLAQAVLLVGYEWFGREECRVNADREISFGDTRPASKAELIGFFEHLEGALDKSGFLFPFEKRPSMVRSLRNLFQREGLTEQDVRTLRGVVSSLTGAHKLKEIGSKSPVAGQEVDK